MSKWKATLTLAVLLLAVTAAAAPALAGDHWNLDYSTAGSGVTVYIGEYYDEVNYNERGAACVNGTYIPQFFADVAWYIDIEGSDYADTIVFIDSAYNCAGTYIYPFDDGEVIDIDIWGNGGDDTIVGQSEERAEDPGQSIWGGDGDDNISGGNENDWISGDAGNDVISAGAGCDEIYGGDGNDIMYLGAYNGDSGCTASLYQTARGGGGWDAIYGTAGEDFIVGGAAIDYLVGYGGSDILVGGGGADFIYGGDGLDCLFGKYHDTKYPYSSTWDGSDEADGDDELYGEGDMDFLCDTGSGEDDLFSGGDGSDYYYQSHAGDTVSSAASWSTACSIECIGEVY